MSEAGGRIGGALSDLLAETLTKHKAASAGLDAELRTVTVAGLMEQMETELAPLMRDVLGWVADDEAIPEHVRAFARQAIEPGHQTDLIIQMIGAVASVVAAIGTLGRPGLQHALNTLWVKYPNAPLSPEVLAAAVVRGQIGFGAAADEAAQSGTDEPRFEILYNLAGNPPAPDQLLLAYRRHIIDKTRLEHGIRQSQLRDEWTDVIEALGQFPMSIGDAVTAAVEGHLSHEAAKEIATEQGLLPQHFDTMFEAGGSPPGPGEIGELLNRGIWDIDRAHAAMRESRIKPKYEDDVLALREALPPREALVLMIERGVLDHATAVHKFRQLGYNTENATFLVQEALNRKMHTERELTKGEITQLYGSGLIDHATALDFVGQLGFDSHESEMILDLVDAQAERHARQTAQSKVHALYVNYRIELPEASSDLDQLGVIPAVRDQLLKVWTLERESNAKDLTLAQLTTAFKVELIDRPTYLDRVHRIGYSQQDALMLAEIAIPSSP